MLAVVSLVLVGSGAPAWASCAPSFDAGECAWKATHIVVARPDGWSGRLKVVESWAGDLSLGDTVVVPALAPLIEEELQELSGTPQAASMEVATICSENGCSQLAERDVAYRSESGPRQIHFRRLCSAHANEFAITLIRAGRQFGFGISPGSGRKVAATGQRLLLFLVKAAKSPTEEGESETWFPAGAGSPFFSTPNLKVSVAWSEGGDTYAFHDVGFGCQRLGFEMPESVLKFYVAEIGRMKAAIALAREASDKGRRAQALEPLAICSNLNAARECFNALNECGDEAVPAFKRLLAGSATSLRRDAIFYAVESLARMQTDASRGEVVSLLDEERTFWDATRGRYAKGWSYLDSEWENHFWKSSALLHALKDYPDTTARTAVERFRTAWQALPAPGPGEALSVLTDVADEVLSRKDSDSAR